jgi:hypothetical protein
MKRNFYPLLSKKYPPATDRLQFRAIRLVCNCGGSVLLDDGQSRLYMLGLWPDRCQRCKNINAVGYHPEINAYLRGTE